jgi:acetate kinase
MKVLVINCGSSSLKYQLIDMSNENVLAMGLVERIAIEGSVLKHSPTGKEKHVTEKPMKDHKDAIAIVLEALTDKEHGVISSINEVNAVGHRIVHGGEFFTKSAIINDEVLKAIEDCIELAPLHNPANLIGINACAGLIQGVKQVAVFDTAFHQTMPEKAYLYALPFEFYEKHKVRRYGFHGTSHKYVSDRAAKVLNKPIESLKLISCHLGNGASVCAIDGGKSVDTSMGLTPLEGLVMGTRSGDIDPAIACYVMEKENISAKEFENILNKESGVFGVSGVSSDFRDIEDAAKAGNKRAQIALDMFYCRVAKYIGSFASVMNGVDGIIFTAGLGENAIEGRVEICNYLTYLGVEIDKDKNNCRGKEVDFSAQNAKVKTLIIPTNEELVIARDTKELLDK